jgi:hypothetical protein
MLAAHSSILTQVDLYFQTTMTNCATQADFTMYMAPTDVCEQ